MKKVLLSSAAVCAMALTSAPALANNGVQLDVGGFFKGYGVYLDQDDRVAATDPRDFDMVRHTEIHFSGETTLDNGLTVGAHVEAEADGDKPSGAATDSFEVEESYVYFSGTWGRVNAGAEDGAAYLLQVAAPSADSNVDGLRQFVQPVNYTSAGSAGIGTYVTANGLDYDQDITGYADKITYLTPVMSGFQAGVSYTFDVADSADDLDGVGLDDAVDTLGSAYEAALRYEGQFNNVGIIAGAGYSVVDLEANTAASGNEDDRTAWNVGLDLDFGPFGAGIAYMEDDFAEPTGNPTDDDEETLVVGVDYTTGPFKLGLSYFDQDNTGNIAGNVATDGVETKRYTGGVTYTYGPGMTFRGSVSRIEHDNVSVTGSTSDEIEATSLLLGTQIKF